MLTKSTLTWSNPKKKWGRGWGGLFLSQSSETCLENILEATIVDQSSQVKSGLDPCKVSARKFGGKKNRNHVLYLPPLIALKMLVKEKAVVDTVVCPPSICALDPEKFKNIIFST